MRIGVSDLPLLAATYLDVLKTIGIMASLLIAAVGLALNAFVNYRNLSARRLLNYQELVRSHRDLWKIALEDTEKYGRILHQRVDLEAKPVTDFERRFVNFLLLHMTMAHAFARNDDLVKIEQMKSDMNDVMTRPIPRSVWFESRSYFNKSFVKFVEGAQPSKRNLWRRRMRRPISPVPQWTVLVLTGFKAELVDVLSMHGDKLIFPASLSDEISPSYVQANKVDMIVCFGYARILRSEVLKTVTAVNVHPGLLPENRGPNPHLWSALGYARRGVTVHFVDKGVDTGDIICRRVLPPHEDNQTFRESHAKLFSESAQVFAEVWPSIRASRAVGTRQGNGGRTFRFRDQEPIAPLLEGEGLDLSLREFRAEAQRMFARQSVGRRQSPPV